MKILGLSAGRKMGNNEVLVKEALMAAEEAGAKVGMIRLLDLDIKPCTGCLACYNSLRNGGSGKCVLKDDAMLLDEHLMESDGVILAAPVFVLGPHGLIKVLSDRFGPSHDVNFRMEAKKMRAAKGITKGHGPDERSFKERVGAFIAVGGASTYYPVSLGLPLMYLFTMSTRIRVVDQMQVLGISLFENVVLQPEILERARRLGRNVAEAGTKPVDQIKWVGDEPGTCPSCHSKLFVVGDRNPVMCPICGIHGKLEVEGGRITVSFTEEELKKSRLAIGGEERWSELERNLGELPDKTQIPEKLKKYKDYREIHVKK
jgi:multimeric flavodoxin WrbA